MCVNSIGWNYVRPRTFNSTYIPSKYHVLIVRLIPSVQSLVYHLHCQFDAPVHLFHTIRFVTIRCLRDDVILVRFYVLLFATGEREFCLAGRRVPGEHVRYRTGSSKLFGTRAKMFKCYLQSGQILQARKTPYTALCNVYIHEHLFYFVDIYMRSWKTHSRSYDKSTA